MQTMITTEPKHELSSFASLPKAVVTHAGRRDGYQLALALDEAGLLQSLVTDFYWNPKVYTALQAALPGRKLPPRICAELDAAHVHSSARAVFADVAIKLLRNRDWNGYKNEALGMAARRAACRAGAALFAYSYYADASFRPGPARPELRFLFQLHPHHQAVHDILAEEMERVPWARAGLMMEAEMRLAPAALERLAGEPLLANGWVAASRYTARTLADQGIPADQIHVVPYGVNLKDFPQRERPPAASDPFTIIYVGSFVQRKGLSYLLESVRALKTKNIRLLLRGRGNIDRELLAHYADVDYDLKTGVSSEELARDLQRSDVFVLPSLAEGFAHVILEAMACGLPIITTANTCAPDVMTEGDQGFIVPIRNSDALAEKIVWGMENRADLAAMGARAAEQAHLFTWERFRTGVRDAYRLMTAEAADIGKPSPGKYIL